MILSSAPGPQPELKRRVGGKSRRQSKKLNSVPLLE
jgi:hypothetical protein